VAELGLARQVAVDLTAEREVADYFEALLAAGISTKLAANWTREEALRLAADKGTAITEAAPIAKMAALIRLVDESKVARVVAKGESDALFACDEEPEAYFTSRGMIQETDSAALDEWVAAVVADNAAVVEQIQGGNVKAIGRLVGAAMKLSGGKADPKAVKAAIAAKLGVEAD
ncbi:MAG: Asp-tRNA(Asn)/Glu-tRNA(Gln) amidotransferase GatCAB subunit B, partial [Planctomycetota bacterium]|nr:Asp-tRNA(Asn)/Glu-tRNA(Gln) amidotransferase GatCAB subunit B [Planctomycetota bacterium]